MNYIILLILTISCLAYADSCVVTDAVEKQYNDLHSNKVTIESTLNSSNYFVTINLPDSIENQSLNAEIQIGIPATLLSNRPDVIASEYNLINTFRVA